VREIFDDVMACGNSGAGPDEMQWDQGISDRRRHEGDVLTASPCGGNKHHEREVVDNPVVAVAGSVVPTGKRERPWPWPLADCFDSPKPGVKLLP
jgi:hypothetical protein